MPLRRPLYVDRDTLFAFAEYYEVTVPHEAEVIEKTVRRGSGGGKLNIAGIGGANASVGRDVEFQTTYALAPREAATVSKVVDQLIAENAVKHPGSASLALSKGDLIEIDGTTRITAASLAGKMLYIARRLMDNIDDLADFDRLEDVGLDDADLQKTIRDVYLRNELIPVPLLLELTNTGLPHKVYISVDAGHFIDTASADRVEDELTVLGTVDRLVEGGQDGYFSAERWLLHDWEYMLRRRLMVDIEDIVRKLVHDLDLDLPADDVHAFLTGPAIVLNAVALY